MMQGQKNIKLSGPVRARQSKTWTAIPHAYHSQSGLSAVLRGFTHLIRPSKFSEAVEPP